MRRSPSSGEPRAAASPPLFAPTPLRTPHAAVESAAPPRPQLGATLPSTPNEVILAHFSRALLAFVDNAERPLVCCEDRVSPVKPRVEQELKSPFENWSWPRSVRVAAVVAAGLGAAAGSGGVLLALDSAGQHLPAALPPSSPSQTPASGEWSIPGLSPISKADARRHKRLSRLAEQLPDAVRLEVAAGIKSGLPRHSEVDRARITLRICASLAKAGLSDAAAIRAMDAAGEPREKGDADEGRKETSWQRLTDDQRTHLPAAAIRAAIGIFGPDPRQAKLGVDDRFDLALKHLDAVMMAHARRPAMTDAQRTAAAAAWAVELDAWMETLRADLAGIPGGWPDNARDWPARLTDALRTAARRGPEAFCKYDDPFGPLGNNGNGAHEIQHDRQGRTLIVKSQAQNFAAVMRGERWKGPKGRPYSDEEMFAILSGQFVQQHARSVELALCRQLLALEPSVGPELQSVPMPEQLRARLIALAELVNADRQAEGKRREEEDRTFIEAAKREFDQETHRPGTLSVPPGEPPANKPK